MGILVFSYQLNASAQSLLAREKPSEKAWAVSKYWYSSAQSIKSPDDLEVTLATLMQHEMEYMPLPHDLGIIRNGEGVHLLPSNIELSGLEVSLEITETSASFTNKRQKVSVFLGKSMEQNDIFHIGMNGEMSAVTFGLLVLQELCQLLEMK